MHFRKKGKAKCDFQYMFDSVELGAVKSFRYLGITLDEHLDLNSIEDQLACASSRALVKS